MHAYSDHDHPEHQHGLAPHEHPQPAPHQDDEEMHVESCDPGQHAVSLVMGCAPLTRVMVIDAERVKPTVIEPLVPLRSIRDVTDVRAHGPPPRTQAAPRAPPLNFPA